MDEESHQARYHIVGIGGIGMSAIAEIMGARGWAVQGSDQNDSDNAARLRSQGIPVFIGHDDANLADATHVIVSTAIKPGNPELEGARAVGLPVISRAEMLAELMRSHPAIAVTGTHGKTTTTSLISWAMTHAGCDPTVINGGILNAWGSNARAGSGEWMVVEADESDATFVKLPARIGVVTAHGVCAYSSEALVVWRPSPVLRISRPVDASANGTSALISEVLPTPDWPTSMPVRPENRRPSVSRPRPSMMLVATTG